MKKIIYGAMVAAMCSCSGSTQSYVVEGAITGAVEGDSISLVTFSRDSRFVAGSVIGKDGAFKIEGSIDYPEMVLLSDADNKHLGMLFLEEGTITTSPIEGAGYSFSGTKLNDANFALSTSIEPLIGEFRLLDAPESPEAEAIIERYDSLLNSAVDANLDNIFGAYIFSYEQVNDMEPSEAKARFAEFSEEVRATESMQRVEKMIEAKLNTEVGKQYINIELPDAEGNAQSVKALLEKGNYVLIDFWATWCSPCRAEMPHLTAAYAEYKDKGFEIYGVSLDQNVDSWKQFLSDKMSWVNVIAPADGVVADMYAVNSIPSNFLIAPNGEIIAKNLRGEEVREKLKELLK